jgi:pyrroloquinoline quinone biosynthesis protein E
MANPLALIAEITHRCPLHCVYCSNPLQLSAANSELPTQDWQRVIAEAAKIGILHLHLTGGEPLARVDLEELVRTGRSAGLYTNLITSGLGLSHGRLQRLVEAGLDHIQISFQDSEAERADWIAGTKAHAHKVELAGWVREHRIAFTANLVVHRQNLDQLDGMIQFLEGLHPDRIEIAHAQYYGWALANRSSLMPTADQLENALRVVDAAQTRLQGRIRIDSVLPDYYAKFPKACMGGWGRQMILINPSGQVLPCHAARVIPGMIFDNVRDQSLSWIWNESAAFQQFRGETWMQEPCRSCDRRHEDYGGCRCQAFLLAGDAAATDPVCSLSPRHETVLHEIQRLGHTLDVARAPGPVESSSAGAGGRMRPSLQSWTYRPNPSRPD